MLLLLLLLLCVAPQASAETFVSLGDSFSSGEAAGPYDPETDNKDGVKRDHKCHRSANAWPRLLGVAREHHLACSGAKLKDLDRGQVDRPPDDTGQIRRLRVLARSVDVDRVLLTIGGNDVGFSSRIRDCRIGSRFCLNNLQEIRVELDRLRPKLADRYRAVRAAGDAPLLVVGYPAIFPAAGARSVNCGWLGTRSQRRADELTGILDRQLARAARDAGVDYVSLLSGGPEGRGVLAGYELCTRHSYVRPITSRPSDLTGDQQQASWGRQYTATLHLSQARHPGAVAGSSANPTLDCGGLLTFPGRDPGGGIQLRETLAYGRERCVDGGTATVTPSAAGASVDVVWSGSADGRPLRDAGTLMRR